MTFLSWSAHLETGIELVDRQHRGLVDLINAAAPGLTVPGSVPREEVASLLARLVDYAATHFRDEEALMARQALHTESVRRHAQGHRAFSREMAAMSAALAQGTIAGEALLSFLAGWLVVHILGEDQAMARQLRARARGLGPMEAYVEADGGDVRPSPAGMNQALVDVYTSLTRHNRALRDNNAALDASRSEVRRQKESLEALVLERTADLRRLAAELAQARDAAEAGSRAKSRFLDAISHELRTPMNAITGFSHLLSGAGLPPEQERLVDRIRKASSHLLELVDAMVEYARLVDGKTPAGASVPFDVKALLDEVCGSRFAAARAKGLATSIDVDLSMPRALRGDARAIGRILQLLLDNAVKFTASGSVAVGARVTGAAADERIAVEFTVSDTGIGITPEVRKILFVPFAQGDGGRDRQHDGVGLGLALAMRLAAIQGGSVGLADAVGTGSRFWLRLPLAAATADATPVTPGADTAPAVASTGVGTTGGDGPAATAALAVGVHDVAALLAAFDARAGDALMRLLPGLRAAGLPADELQQHVEAFEYERALLLLRSPAFAATFESTEEK